MRGAGDKIPPIVPEFDGTNLRLASGPIRTPPIAQNRPDRGRGESVGTTYSNLQDHSSLTYELSFGLREKAFSLSPDPRFFFKESSPGAIFDVLLAGIRRREGILVVTGEVGAGKTTLCRAVVQSLDRTILAAFVPDPLLSREDLLKTLLVDFGVISADNVRGGELRGASRTDLRYALLDFLISLEPLHALAIVVMDEAQDLSTELLHEIRILSDFEHTQTRLLQFLLVGEPGLQSRLDGAEMRRLAQRVSIRSELEPLAAKDVGPYISHRLTIAGNGTLRFTYGAIDRVYRTSGGIPRIINLVCDRALFRADRAGRRTVDAEHVLGAMQDLKLAATRTSGAPSRDRLENSLGSLGKEPVNAPAESEQRQAHPDSPAADPGSALLSVQRTPHSVRSLSCARRCRIVQNSTWTVPTRSGRKRPRPLCGVQVSRRSESRSRRAPLIPSPPRPHPSRTWNL